MTHVRVPHETEPVRWLATAWPTHPDWAEHLEPARAEVATLLRVAAGGASLLMPAGPFGAAEAETAAGKGPAGPSTEGERLWLSRALARLFGLAKPAGRAAGPVPEPAFPPAPAVERAPGAPDLTLLVEPETRLAAERALGGAASPTPAVYGDIWLRDTGPVFAVTPEGPIAVAFRFNGWGGKYVYPGDSGVAAVLARLAECRLIQTDLVAEGGGLEFDGQGTVLSTKQCLLNANRNPSLDAGDIEAILERALGIERVIWVEEGLLGDHTDGHIDNLARFVAPGVVVTQAPAGRDDPNAAVLDAVARSLDGARDAGGRRIEVVRIPSPGFVPGADGRPLAASHMNFVHAGNRILVPTYDAPTTRAALDGLAALFPEKEVIGLPASGVLAEGGAFHCITNAAPALGVKP